MGEKELGKLEKPKWYIIKRNQTKDFIEYEMAADRIDAVAKVFPVFFFLIAILVSLTTMTRMVDEERVYIGSLKAMGYKNISIASKYIIYAALASIGGSIVGLSIGLEPCLLPYIMPDIIIEYNSPLCHIIYFSSSYCHKFSSTNSCLWRIKGNSC